MKSLLSIFAILVFSVSLNAQLDRSVPPSAQPNPKIEINIPDPMVFENGLKVIVVENHKLPKVSFQLYVDHPILSEGNKAGMSGIFGELLSSGTENTPKDAFDEKIDYMGAELFTNSRGFFASSLKKHTPKLLDLLHEVIVSPAFPQDEFDRIKNQTLSGLASSKSDPNSMASIVGSVVNYGGTHPYGEVMTEETLENISLEDIKAHYAKYFIPNYAYLIIVGDVSKEEAKQYVEKYFLDWKKGAEEKQQSFRHPQSMGNNVYFVDKPGAVQSVIKITHTIDIKPGHEDAIALSVLNKILGGGGFAARLMANLREDKAYTYGCYSSMRPDELIGEFSAGGSFRNDVTDSAIVQILYEIKNIVETDVTEKELDLAKKSMTGSFARSLEQAQTIARFALNTARYKLSPTYYADYLKKLEAVTIQDLKRVALKYLHPNNLNIIVVGNAQIIDKLAVFDTDGKMSFKNHYGEDAVMLKSAPEGVTAKSVVETYLLKTFKVDSREAMNAKLAKIGYIETTATSYIEEMDATLTMTTYRGTPNKSAMIMKVNSSQGNMIAQKEWFNGTEGGSFTMGVGKKKYEGEELEDKKKPSFPFSQIYYFDNQDLSVELMGIDEIEGKQYYKVKIQKKGETDFGYEYYGVESGLLEFEESFSTDDEGNTMTVTITYSDYKDMGKGIVVPHKMSINSDGQVISFETTSVKVKKKPKSKTFDGVFK